MTNLTDDHTDTSPAGTPTRAKTDRPEGAFLIELGQDDLPRLTPDTASSQNRVHLDGDGNIHIQWSHEDSEAELSFKASRGQLEALSVGWLTENLDSTRARSLPFTALRPLGAGIIVSVANDPDHHTYACYLAVRWAGRVHAHDPKIYNDAPGDPGDPC